MQSYEVLKEAFESPTTSPKEIAAEMGVSLSLVYKWAQPNDASGSGSKNPLDRVAQLVDLTKHTGIVDWLCHEAGGYYVKNPQGTGFSREHDVFPATHEIVAQFAGLLEVVSKAAMDNTITKEESIQIRRVWDKLKSYCEGFVRCCEEGDFQRIKEDLGSS